MGGRGPCLAEPSDCPIEDHSGVQLAFQESRPWILVPQAPCFQLSGLEEVPSTLGFRVLGCRRLVLDQRNSGPFQFQQSSNVMFLKEFLRLVSPGPVKTVSLSRKPKEE